MFGFSSVVRSSLTSLPLVRCSPCPQTHVNMSGGKLRYADFYKFRNVTRLILDNNEFGLQGLKQSGLFTNMPQLDELSLCKNKFTKMETLAYIVNKLPKIR